MLLVRFGLILNFSSSFSLVTSNVIAEFLYQTVFRSAYDTATISLLPSPSISIETIALGSLVLTDSSITAYSSKVNCALLLMQKRNIIIRNNTLLLTVIYKFGLVSLEHRIGLSRKIMKLLPYDTFVLI